MFSLLRCLCRSWNCARPDRDRQEPPSKEADNDPTDDLTDIRGIGIATQNRLNTSGIKTYAQLAEASPDHLQEILGGRIAEGRIKHWIAEARKLAADAEK